MILFLIGILILIWSCYKKYNETKQIEEISKMNWLTFDQIESLIEKIKE